jgi:hypothetical protein
VSTLSSPRIDLSFFQSSWLAQRYAFRPFHRSLTQILLGRIHLGKSPQPAAQDYFDHDGHQSKRWSSSKILYICASGRAFTNISIYNTCLDMQNRWMGHTIFVYVHNHVCQVLVTDFSPVHGHFVGVSFTARLVPANKCSHLVFLDLHPNPTVSILQCPNLFLILTIASISCARPPLQYLPGPPTHPLLSKLSNHIRCRFMVANRHHHHHSMYASQIRRSYPSIKPGRYFSSDSTISYICVVQWLKASHRTHGIIFCL